MKQISFRDPIGKVYESNNRIYRAINKNKKKFFEKLLSEDWYKTLVNEEKIQISYWLKDINNDLNYFNIEHKKFDFPIFPHEMCSEQLYESALLTLEIAIVAFKHKIILTDASAWNVLFDKSKPIFCDITSFEEWKGEKLWFAYGQFCRHYVIPLILAKYLKTNTANLFLTNRDGINPEDAQHLLGFKTIKSFCALEVITLPTIFKNKKFIDINLSKKELNEKIFLNTLYRLKKYILNLKPIINKSIWTEYENSRKHYSLNDLTIKYNFLNEAFKMIKGSVLDLGCNQGEYSYLAEKNGLKVIASDFDQNCLNKLQSNINLENITVCYLDICQPTPAIGWNNKEHRSFLKRSNNKFNLVLCLGLLHHLIVAERIPLNFIFETISTITNEYALIEYIDKDDEKFKEISYFNRDLYSDFTVKVFEKNVLKKFIIIKKVNLEYLKRTLYLIKKI